MMDYGRHKLLLLIIFTELKIKKKDCPEKIGENFNKRFENYQFINVL